VLPAVPRTTSSTTITSTASSQQQQQQHTGSATPFNDDGHYTDVHWRNGGSSGAVRIPTWRQSFDDEFDHYNCIGLNQLTNDDILQQTAPDNGYDSVEMAALSQPPAPHYYADIESDQPRSRIDPQGFPEAVERSKNGNHGSMEQTQQPSRPQDHNTLRSATKQQKKEVNRQVGTTKKNYKLRRPRRPHTYAGGDTSSMIDSPDLLEPVTDYSGTNNLDDPGTTAKDYKTEVEEMRRRANKPHDEVGLTDGNSGNRQGEVMESEDDKGLDPVEVEEARQRARRPHEYAGLRENLYSRPMKKH